MSLNLSLPGNPRYQPTELIPIFGYDNLYRPAVEVELATMRTLAEIGVILEKDIALLTNDVTEKLLAITTTDVDKVEREVTKHDIRALVRIMQEILPTPLRRWVHVPLTSYDVLDTARSLQFTRAHKEVVSPKTKEVIRALTALVDRFAGTVQIGRTHGQHAIPITVGFWMACVLDRIMHNAGTVDVYGFFPGKISGPVGAANAQVLLGINERCGQVSFEVRVLRRLGLEAAFTSTQILPPEPLASYLFACTVLSASFGQFGRDARHLMRSEIGEIAEAFETGQVGSSTMAHKRNPINFESLEGMYLRTKNEFGKVLDTLVSEHQRDLVGSSVARDLPIIVVNVVQQMNTLLRRDKEGRTFLSRITVPEEALKRNLGLAAPTTMAEPIYLALQMAGYEGDAHELVNHTLMKFVGQEGNNDLSDALDYYAMLSDTPQEVKAAIEKIPEDLRQALREPEQYIGNARERALGVAARAREYINPGRLPTY